MGMCRLFVPTLALVTIFKSACALLSVHPPVLFLDEDWAVGKALDVQICASTPPTDVRLVDQDGQQQQALFRVVPLNDSCATLVLQKALDADRPFTIDVSPSSPNIVPPTTSFALLFEQASSGERATLQIELVDVNDNTPLFVGGPFPAHLAIPENTPVGTLLRRLQVLDRDGGIGGVCRFLLEYDDNAFGAMFALDNQQCLWPHCFVELRLRQKMARGQSVQLKVRAKDGAGLTRKANEAHVELLVEAVPTAGDEGAGNSREGQTRNGNSSEDEEEGTTAGAIETTETTFSTQRDRTAALSPTSTAIVQPTTQWTLRTAAVVDQQQDISSTSSPVPALPVREFHVSSLSEDTPVGLELLRVPLPPAPNSSSVQFVELGGGHFLRMLANGSVRVAAPLDAHRGELVAQVRRPQQQHALVAIVRLKVEAMVDQFEEWLRSNVPAGGSRMTVVRSGASKWRVLRLPTGWEKYARVDSGDAQLEGSEVTVPDGTQREQCFWLSLQFRREQRRRKVCAVLPKEQCRLRMLLPANNSRHAFKENVPLPSALLRCKATAVWPPSLPVTFTLDDHFGDSAPLFTMDASTGELFVRSGEMFDFEARRTHALAITACGGAGSDQQQGQCCARIVVHIDVLDANDHCPHFETHQQQQDALLAIGEDTAPNGASPIAQFGAALDEDGSVEMRSVCYALANSFGGTFAIPVPQRPELHLAKALDRELVSSYALEIRAIDCPGASEPCNDNNERPSPPLPFVLRLNVSVTDANDNAPLFVQRHFFAPIVRPSAQPGDALLRLEARDADEGDAGRLRFGWGEGMVQTDAEPLPIADSPLRINRTTGEVLLRRELDTLALDKAAFFTFRVRVRDSGAVHEDQASVTLSVLDASMHLVQLHFCHDSLALEAELDLLEQLLSLWLGWRALTQRLSQCGANCTQMSAYCLDRDTLRAVPAHQVLAEMAPKRGGADAARALDALQARFGLEWPPSPAEAVITLDSAESAPTVRLFPLSPVGALFAILSCLFLLSIALVVLRRLCVHLKVRAARSSDRFAKRVRLDLGTAEWRKAGVAVNAPAAVLSAAEKRRQIRWEASHRLFIDIWDNITSEFEFPAAPPPVHIYGAAEDTLPLGRQQTLMNGAVSTEF